MRGHGLVARVGLIGLLLFLGLVGGTAPSAARATDRGEDDRNGPHGEPGGGRPLTVLTQNLFVGAEFSQISAATSIPELLQAVAAVYAQVQANNFSQRAEALAALIVREQPDLIGLQEASLFRIETPSNGPATLATRVDADYVELLLGALRRHGQRYRVAAAIEVFDAEIPHGFPPTMDIRLTDREVILVREGPGHSVPEIVASQTGHFTTFLSVPTAAGPLPSRRGWASVDVRHHGQQLRFISTHLEPAAPPIQVAQGTELLSGPANTPMPVIMVGDFNSAADGSTTPTYGNLIAGGFADAWSSDHPGVPGLTCCHGADLRIEGPPFNRRIDLILTRGGFRARQVEVLGEARQDKTRSGLWPSDHAGVAARLALP
jgi:endonuclease/exonuclease/phosphatase family metal-dependent hydrolase